MREHVRLRMRQTGRVGLMMLALTLSGGCAMQAGSETERSICRELRADLPTWSRYDTPESLAQGARFVTVFEGVCNQ